MAVVHLLLLGGAAAGSGGVSLLPGTGARAYSWSRRRHLRLCALLLLPRSDRLRDHLCAPIRLHYRHFGLVEAPRLPALLGSAARRGYDVDKALHDAVALLDSLCAVLWLVDGELAVVDKRVIHVVSFVAVADALLLDDLVAFCAGDG